MMLNELGILFERVPAGASRETYGAAIVSANELAKPSRTARRLAFEHMAALYGLDSGIPLFRILRRLWDRDPAARPLLALEVALARDSLLRAVMPWLLAKPEGALVQTQELDDHLALIFADRFSPTTRVTLAQRLKGTWSQSGHLYGKVRRTRARAKATPSNVAFALFLGYLSGSSGPALLKTPWVDALDLSQEDLDELLRGAVAQELIVYRSASGVVEFRFPGWLTAAEEAWREEVVGEPA